jgi:hypothetical protein
VGPAPERAPGFSLIEFVAVGVGAASAAHAGTKIIASAPALRSIPTLHNMFCDITNLDLIPRSVTIEEISAVLRTVGRREATRWRAAASYRRLRLAELPDRPTDP